MQSIKPACVNICCACNDKYAPPLAVCLYSLLCNTDKIRLYDIMILHSDITPESRKPRAVELLNSRQWMYNDRDVLNMLFKDSIHNFDMKWNYNVNIECEPYVRDPKIRQLMADAHRIENGVIHYTGSANPWNGNAILVGALP